MGEGDARAPGAQATPLGLVRDAKPLYEGEAVNLLGRFLFRYEQAREPVGSLSGGELFRYEGGYSAWRERAAPEPVRPL